MATNKTNAIPTWNEVKQLHPNIVEINAGYSADDYVNLLEMLAGTARVFVDTDYINKDNCIAIYKFTSNNTQKQYHIFGYTRTGHNIILIYLSGYFYKNIGDLFSYANGIWIKVNKNSE